MADFIIQPLPHLKQSLSHVTLVHLDWYPWCLSCFGPFLEHQEAVGELRGKDGSTQLMEEHWEH